MWKPKVAFREYDEYVECAGSKEIIYDIKIRVFNYFLMDTALQSNLLQYFLQSYLHSI